MAKHLTHHTYDLHIFSRGNLSIKNLADVVTKENFVSPDSEFLETLLVAVPKLVYSHGPYHFCLSWA
jgi:hypothetical protein